MPLSQGLSSTKNYGQNNQTRHTNDKKKPSKTDKFMVNYKYRTNSKFNRYLKLRPDPSREKMNKTKLAIIGTTFSSSFKPERRQLTQFKAMTSRS